jgi:hypothetical protein
MRGGMDTYARIVELSEEERHVQHQGRDMLRGRSLTSLVRELGGYEGEVREYLSGQPHQISLLPWRDRDPDATWLDIQFITENA